MFFAEAQNKLIYAVTNKTAAELIVSRADAHKPNMALTAWRGKIVRKQDVIIAKNYLNEDELDTLNRLVLILLETAELRAKNRQNITMKFWQENIDRILSSNDYKILAHKGQISNPEMEERVGEIYSKFDSRRKSFEAKIADEEDLKELESLVKNNTISHS
jgi:hypothetical protein